MVVHIPAPWSIWVWKSYGRPMKIYEDDWKSMDNGWKSMIIAMAYGKWTNHGWTMDDDTMIFHTIYISIEHFVIARSYVSIPEAISNIVMTFDFWDLENLWTSNMSLENRRRLIFFPIPRATWNLRKDDHFMDERSMKITGVRWANWVHLNWWKKISPTFGVVSDRLSKFKVVLYL